MDPDEPIQTILTSSVSRKVRFAPKSPPRRKPKPVEPKIEVADDAEGEAAQTLLKRVNEHLGRRGPKAEVKSSVQVAFGHGAASSTSIKTYGINRDESKGRSISPGVKDSSLSDGKVLYASPSTAKRDKIFESSVHNEDEFSQKKKKDYCEPWDYHQNDYPVTLPLRKPYSGDPEQLDEEEFGNAAMDVEYDENVMNHASELGLLEQNEEAQLLFLQLPSNLPLTKRSTGSNGTETAECENGSPGAKGKEIAGIAMSSGGTGVSARISAAPHSAKGKEVVGSSRAQESKKSISLEELPGGYMGKMLVYKSGAIKLKLGSTLFDVSPGSDCKFAQDVAAINMADKHCCVLGELGKHAVVTPDVDSLLNNVIDLG